MLNFALYFTFFLFISTNINADDIDLNAKEILIDKNQDIIAKDNVNIDYINYNLKADYIKYSKSNSLINAKDNIKYFNKLTGEKILAMEIKASKDFLNFTLHDSLLMLPNDNSYYAQFIERKGKEIIVKKGSFTPCKICDGKNYQIPKWKISASKVYNHADAKNIYFYNSFFRIYNIPIFYMPYFYYPKERNLKQSGFLRADYNNNSLYGDIISLPFFLNLAPNYDLTYTPHIFTKVNNINHKLEFRHISKQSKSLLNISYINENDKMKKLTNETNEQNLSKNKWSIKLDSQADLNDNVSLDVNLHDLSDQIYNQRYNNNYDNFYRSNIDLAYIENNHSLILSTAKFSEFEDNQLNHNDYYHLPYIKYYSHNKNGNFIIKNDLRFKSLKYDNKFTRENINYNFTISKNYSLLQNIATNISFTNDLRIYHNDVLSDDKLYIDTNPQLIIKNNYPLIHKGKIKHIVTPELNFFIANDNNNSSSVTNISSSSSKINHSNISSGNIISGEDMFINGSRLSYGINDFLKFKYFSLKNYIGQLYFLEDQDLQRESGFSKGFSDVIGKLSLVINEKFNINYNYKLRNNDYNPYHQFYNISYNNKTLSASIGYTKYKYHLVESSYLDYVDYLSSNFDYKLNDKLLITINHERNLLPKSISQESGSVRSGIFINIMDDCVRYDLGYSKEYINNSSTKTNHSITFNIILTKI